MCKSAFYRLLSLRGHLLGPVCFAWGTEGVSLRFRRDKNCNKKSLIPADQAYVIQVTTLRYYGLISFYLSSCFFLPAFLLQHFFLPQHFFFAAFFLSFFLLMRNFSSWVYIVPWPDQGTVYNVYSFFCTFDNIFFSVCRAFFFPCIFSWKPGCLTGYPIQSCTTLKLKPVTVVSTG